jgi:hypothetical protein
VASTTEVGTIAAPSTTTPPAFAAGQWAKYSVTRGETSSTLEYKVLSKEGDAFWFEVVNDHGGKSTVIQFLLAAADRTEPESYDLRAAKIGLPNGKVQVLRGAQLKMTRKMLDGFLARLRVPEFGKGPQEDAVVPAGKFRQCYVHEVSGTYFGMKTDSKVWNHPVVPISTLVRSIDRADGAVVVLEGYGMEGARSSMD